MIRRGTWVSRTLALALFGACVFGLVFMAIVPIVQSHAHLDQRIDTLSDTLARYADRRENPKSLRDRIATLKRTSAANAALWKGKSHSRISAALLTRIKHEAKTQGGVLRSTQILKPNTAELFPRIAIRADLEITPDGLKKLFHRLEYGTPYLFIDDLQITGRMEKMVIPAAQNGKKPGSWQKLILTVRFSIFGYAKAETKG